ncbi:MAG: DEAD/DEAH box helicase family protein [Xanthobacteraceae bacterium]
MFDEAHRARGRTREAILEKYPDAIWVGLTATPCRGDGRGLGNTTRRTRTDTRCVGVGRNQGRC